MFVRNKQLQYPVRVDKPDPLFATQVQELLGGKYGEFTVMAQGDACCTLSIAVAA